MSFDHIFGKTGSGWLVPLEYDVLLTYRLSRTSGLEEWEAPDPAEWIQRGYAVVNTDARGTFKSEGNMAVHGTQEGRDGYDTFFDRYLKGKAMDGKKLQN
ncbi:hypothetical protein LTR64_003570 [Lithohypha guttulata]|uniref:Xaa-Pro dipeptidyl-peptidase-like domain-containing protein n=1 Tax=Lithohypha guttulata TaxID=1690604 RepID=A0AAN7SYU5_9EURO|nr:hypothetical protein LTR51_000210 [Lithohypha guttulata]KAK5085403.1 hypothetical protein LTR05_004688 [Lithohypha guttulata]